MDRCEYATLLVLGGRDFQDKRRVCAALDRARAKVVKLSRICVPH